MHVAARLTGQLPGSAVHHDRNGRGGDPARNSKNKFECSQLGWGVDRDTDPGRHWPRSVNADGGVDAGAARARHGEREPRRGVEVNARGGDRAGDRGRQREDVLRQRPCGADTHSLSPLSLERKLYRVGPNYGPTLGL